MYIDQATFHLINQRIKRTGCIELPAEGTSMFPLIKRGDICRFELCHPNSLERADIALFYTRMGQLVAHRYYHKQLVDEKIVFLFKGDANLCFDGPISEDQIVGRLALIQRVNKIISLQKPTVVLWGKLIMAIPVLSGLLQRYLLRKSLIQLEHLHEE